MSTGDAGRWAVVLAGGVGSRFWPVSTPRRPKQLLPLASDTPLIRETVERITPLVPQERLRILTGGHLARLVPLGEVGAAALVDEPAHRVAHGACLGVDRVDQAVGVEELEGSLHHESTLRRVGDLDDARFASLLDHRGAGGG